MWVCSGEGVGTHPSHPVLTSSGCHRSGRYASYWNAFLLQICLLIIISVKLSNLNVLLCDLSGSCYKITALSILDK